MESPRALNELGFAQREARVDLLLGRYQPLASVPLASAPFASPYSVLRDACALEAQAAAYLGAVLEFEALDTRLQRRVRMGALVLADRPDGGLPAAVERVQHRLQQNAKLLHANVVAIYDVAVTRSATENVAVGLTRDAALLLVALEAPAGIDLSAFLAHPACTAAAVVDVFAAAAHALAAAHATGLFLGDSDWRRIIVDERDPRAARMFVADFTFAEDSIPTSAAASNAQAQADIRRFARQALELFAPIRQRVRFGHRQTVARVCAYLRDLAENATASTMAMVAAALARYAEALNAASPLARRIATAGGVGLALAAGLNWYVRSVQHANRRAAAAVAQCTDAARAIDTHWQDVWGPALRNALQARGQAGSVMVGLIAQRAQTLSATWGQSCAVPNDLTTQCLIARKNELTQFTFAMLDTTPDVVDGNWYAFDLVGDAAWCAPRSEKAGEDAASSVAFTELRGTPSRWPSAPLAAAYANATRGRLYRAQVFAQRGKAERALQEIEAVIAHSKDRDSVIYAEALLAKSGALELSAETDEAAAALQHAVTSAAAVGARHVLARALLNWAVVAVDEEVDSKRASELIERADVAISQNGGGPFLTAQLPLARGMVAGAAGNDTKAMGLLSSALAAAQRLADPEVYKVYAALAFQHESADRTATAIELTRSALAELTKLESPYALEVSYRTRLVQQMVTVGVPADALGVAERTVALADRELAPTAILRAIAYAAYADAQFHNGDIDAAIATDARAIALLPASAQSKSKLFFQISLYGVIHMISKDPRRALEACQTLCRKLEYQPKVGPSVMAPCYEAMTEAARAAERLDLALAAAEREAVLLNESGVSQGAKIGKNALSRAQVLLLLHRDREAVAAYQEAERELSAKENPYFLAMALIEHASLAVTWEEADELMRRGFALVMPQLQAWAESERQLLLKKWGKLPNRPAASSPR